MSDTQIDETQQDSEAESVYSIPGKETLVVTSSDIREAIEDDWPTKFTVEEQRLRYIVDVEVVDELCAHEGCDEVPIFEGKNGKEYCSPACLEAGHNE